MNPIVSQNTNGARPGGRVVEVNGKLYRFGQVCSPYYGYDLRFYEIMEITPERYSEKAGSEAFFSTSMKLPRWMAHGRHHIDALRLEDGRWLVAADGFRWRCRLGTDRKMPLKKIKTVFLGMRNRRVSPIRSISA